MQQDVDVDAQQDAHGEQDEPDDRRLLEVALEGAEELLHDVAFLVTGDLERDVVERGGRGADGEDGKAAHKP